MMLMMMMIIEYCHFESLNQLRLRMLYNVMLLWYQWTSIIILKNILLWGLWLKRFRDYITSEGPFFSPSRVPVSSKQLHSVTRSDWQYCYPSNSQHNNFMLNFAKYHFRILSNLNNGYCCIPAELPWNVQGFVSFRLVSWMWGGE